MQAGEYLEVSGVLENVTSLTVNDQQFEISFTVDGVDFTSYTDCTKAHSEALTEGTPVTVQYGYIGRDLAIYRIYINEAE
jgi:hypothetical protein